MPTWRTSSYSQGGNTDCVEIAHDQPGVLIRDSKNPDGPTLAVSFTRWESFVRLVHDA